MTVRVEFEFRDEKEAEIFKNYIENGKINTDEDVSTKMAIESYFEVAEKQIADLFFEKVKNFKYSENNRKLEMKL